MGCLRAWKRHQIKYHTISHIPEILNASSLMELLELIGRLSVCPGNPDERFVEMFKPKVANDGTLRAYVDSEYDVTMNEEVFHSTVHMSSCSLILKEAGA